MVSVSLCWLLCSIQTQVAFVRDFPEASVHTAHLSLYQLKSQAGCSHLSWAFAKDLQVSMSQRCLLTSVHNSGAVEPSQVQPRAWRYGVRNVL